MVGVIGGVVLVGGIILIPSPGPGWLMVFAGLAVLGSEFEWAHRLLRAVRRRYDAWTAWIRRQSPLVQLVMVILSGVVVLVSLWLFNAFGLIAEMIGLDWSWLRGPIG
ncbi:MAG: TIGR02611 family protein [Actinomycetota bacterium]|nr:TIGR02611 family protein [Actinomycetota bacterium]